MSETPPRKKAVYDTGVVLQAALSDRGPSFHALRLLEEGRVIVVLSPQVRHEYEDVLTRPAIRRKHPFLTPERVQLLLDRIEARAEPVTVIRPYLQYPRDPKDEPILNLAIQEQADFIVTRDRDLLDLDRSRDFRLLYPYLRIVDPLLFVQQLTQAPATPLPYKSSVPPDQEPEAR